MMRPNDPEGEQTETESPSLQTEPSAGSDSTRYQQGSNILAPEVPSTLKESTSNMFMLNRRALPEDAETYMLETFKKNVMIIFNHEDVEGFEKRTGTAEDVASLRKTFERFGFEITDDNIHNDLTKIKLFAELKKFSERDFTEYGCVAVVILTHGTGNGLLRAKDWGQLYSEMDVINHFKFHNKPTLITKPVILLIQACRGKNSTQGVPVNQQYKIHKDGNEEDISPYYLPVESDILIVHSAFPGKPAFRLGIGSWFIQTLCTYIDKLSRTQDLESILTEVKKQVAINKYTMKYNYTTDEWDVNKQMPVVTSTLIRKLFLRKYEDGSLSVPRPLTGIEIQREEGQNRNRTEYVSTTVTRTLTGIEIQREEQNRREDSRAANPRTMVPGANDSCVHQFQYMKKCFRLISQYSNDGVANEILYEADLENGTNEERTKSLLKVMSDYLQENFRQSEYYDYIYFNEANTSNDANCYACTLKYRLQDYIGQNPDDVFAKDLLSLLNSENGTDKEKTKQILDIISRYMSLKAIK